MTSLNLEVVCCSSEEIDRPAANLNVKIQQNPGWQSSAQNSRYPIEVTFKIIEGPSHLRSLHILSHEYKISSKIELHLGIPRNGVFARTYEECEYIVLGFFILFIYIVKLMCNI
jgi:hypothetical protein